METTKKEPRSTKDQSTSAMGTIPVALRAPSKSLADCMSLFLGFISSIIVNSFYSKLLKESVSLILAERGLTIIV